jgi:hypothetical protein
MPHQYSAENHDWDLTLHTAHELLQIGKIMDQRPSTGNMSMEFSAYVGSMLLSFSAIESFSASVAFSMPRIQKYRSFDFETYRRITRFWDKIEMLFATTGQPIDKSSGMFQTISEMQLWRNLVTHSSPYRIETTEINNTTSEVRKLHRPKHKKEYTRCVKLDQATKFYNTAFDYIDFLKASSDLNPRASAMYSIGET